MGTFVYAAAAVKLHSATIVWTTDNINAALVTRGYSANDSNLYFSEVPTGSIVVRDMPVTNRIVTADNRMQGSVGRFLALSSPLPIAGFILYRNTGVDATSELLYYSSEAVGMPLNPLGLNWQVAFDQAHSGFFWI